MNSILEKKIRIDFAILVVIFAMTHNFFYISKGLSDITLILCVLFGSYICIKYRNVKLKNYKFKTIAVFMLLLVIMSSIRAYELYQQQFMVGFRAQRIWAISFLMYFPICKLLATEKIKVEQIENVIYVLAVIEVILFTIQYFLVGKVDFLNITIDYRYDTPRLRFIGTFINWATFVAANHLLNGKNKIRNFLLLVIFIAFNIVIGKTRLIIVALIVPIFISVLLWKRKLDLKIIMLFFSIIGLVIIFNTTAMQDMFAVLTGDEDDGSYEIRLEGRELYAKQLEDSPIIGRGFPSTENEKASQIAGFNDYIYLNDNGIYGFQYMYGMIGLVWVMIMYFKIYKRAYQIYKLEGNYFYLMYILYATMTLPNILVWYWGYQALYMVIYIAMLETKYNKIKKECEQEDGGK